MKTTLSSTYRVLQNNINDISQRLLDQRIKTTTQKRVNKPSDDPSVIKPMIDTRAEITAADRYLRNTGTALDNMSIIENNLDRSQNIMLRAKEIAISAVSGIHDADSRATLAIQVSELKDELLSTANAQHNGKHIFAGLEEGTQPFTTNGAYASGTYNAADPTTYPVLYFSGSTTAGNPEFTAKSLEIAPGETLNVTLTGNEVFIGDSDGDGDVDAGNVDLFKVLSDLEDALNSNSVPDVEAQMDNLDTGINQVIGLTSRLGIYGERMQKAQNQLEDTKLDLEAILSRYQDADLVETVNALAREETAFQAALNVTARVSQISILDFL